MAKLKHRAGAVVLLLALSGAAGQADEAATGQNFNTWLKDLAVDQALLGEGQAVAARFNCAGCHDAAKRRAGTPVLRGLPAQYAYQQWQAYAAGERRATDNGAMEKLAQRLTERERQAVSAWYASLEWASRAPLPNDATARGIVGDGASVTPVPACINCHGLESLGVTPWVPPLAGQDAGYMIRRLLAWKTGKEGEDRYAEMSTIAQRLSEEEIRAVSRYLGMQSAAANNQD